MTSPKVAVYVSIHEQRVKLVADAIVEHSALDAADHPVLHGEHGRGAGQVREQVVSGATVLVEVNPPPGRPLLWCS